MTITGVEDDGTTVLGSPSMEMGLSMYEYDTIIRGVESGDATVTVLDGAHGLGGALTISTPHGHLFVELPPREMRTLADALNERARIVESRP